MLCSGSSAACLPALHLQGQALVINTTLAWPGERSGREARAMNNDIDSGKQMGLKVCTCMHAIPLSLSSLLLVGF